MYNEDIHRTLERSIKELTRDHSQNYPYIPLYNKELPESKSVGCIIDMIRSIIFPGYFGSPLVNINTLEYHAGVNIEKLYNSLSEQIFRALFFNSENENFQDTKKHTSEIAMQFISKLPEIKYLLSTDVRAILEGDPAAKGYAEVIFCYPAMKALLNHRVSHELLKLNVPLIPRIISEIAHAETGIDIHPGAQIDEYFSIDHGTGVVIGQTAIIGKHVRLYQGVTLGAKSFTLDQEGRPMDTPRHPILEDNVTIYSNSTILGRITIGKGTVVGGNIWLTHSVPPNSKILQSKAMEFSYTDGLGI